MAASVVALAVAAIVALVASLSIRSDVDRGRTSLLAARAAFARGDFSGAARTASAAAGAFDRAARGPRAWVVRTAALVPYAGHSARTLLGLVDVGRGVSVAAGDIARSAANLRGGLDALGPSGGRLPIAQLESIAPALHRAAVALTDARTRANALPATWLIGPVASARASVVDALGRAAPVARAADALVREVPSFAGATGPRRYLVGIQNSAELRGTGGVVGNVAVLTLDRGRLSLGRFQDVAYLRNVPAREIAPPSPQYSRLYDAFGGAGFWLNVNMTPDAPTAATAMERLYERDTGVRVDGTILFDLQGLADLLHATGPVHVPELGETFTSANMLGAIASSRYLQSSIPNPFVQGPRLVAAAVWQRFLAVRDAGAALSALSAAAGRGDLVLHARDDAVEAAFERAGLAGSFRAGSGDTVGVVLSNAAANKVDYYLRESLEYRVTLRSGGEASTEETVRLLNAAPAGHAPNYPLGPSGQARAAHLPLVTGEDRWWSAFYCSRTCTVRSATSGGRTLPLEMGRENGLPVYSTFLDARPQRAVDVRLSATASGVWSGDAAGGSYRLVVRGQRTPQPTRATVAITAPAGMRISWTSVPMHVEGATATWSGDPGPRTVLLVRFQRGLLGRIGARVWSFLTHPVFHL